MKPSGPPRLHSACRCKKSESRAPTAATGLWGAGWPPPPRTLLRELMSGDTAATLSLHLWSAAQTDLPSVPEGGLATSGDPFCKPFHGGTAAGGHCLSGHSEPTLPTGYGGWAGKCGGALPVPRPLIGPLPSHGTLKPLNLSNRGRPPPRPQSLPLAGGSTCVPFKTGPLALGGSQVQPFFLGGSSP